jgi:hypothetical protein
MILKFLPRYKNLCNFPWWFEDWTSFLVLNSIIETGISWCSSWLPQGLGQLMERIIKED